jgi:hypothetical protein
MSECRSLTRQVSPFTHCTISGGGIQKFGQHLYPPPSILLQELADYNMLYTLWITPLANVKPKTGSALMERLAILRLCDSRVRYSNQKLSFADPAPLTQSRCIGTPPLPEQVELHRDQRSLNSLSH